jgi:hypothetical protein
MSAVCLLCLQVVKEGFDPNVGLFKATTDNKLYPNPHAQVRGVAGWLAGWLAVKTEQLGVQQAGAVACLKRRCARLPWSD